MHSLLQNPEVFQKASAVFSGYIIPALPYAAAAGTLIVAAVVRWAMKEQPPEKHRGGCV